MRVTAYTIGVAAFFRRELDDIRIVANPAKAVALPPKGHAPPAGEISLPEFVHTRIVGEGGVTVMDVPIGAANT